ncbi:hypothetical protein ACFVW1_34815 [Streptomyces olivochromogenes]|uniref:hypothetical protein n=1 Tax=Streptomyces olivochromogenes TaxID=1963 RepID=UPI0036D85C89
MLTIVITAVIVTAAVAVPVVGRGRVRGTVGRRPGTVRRLAAEGRHRGPTAPTAHARREPGASAGSPDRRRSPELAPQGERDKLTLRLALRQYREITERLLPMSAPASR